MDKYLNNDEERLFDLIETKELDELTAEELAFVEAQMTPQEYNLQRRMITEAPQLYPSSSAADSLIIAPKKGFTGKTVPLYQAIAAVAATIVLFLSLWPSETAASRRVTPSENTAQLNRTDTVVRTEIVLDTIIRYVESREKHRIDGSENTRQDAVVQASQLRILDAPPVPLPKLTEELFKTKGSSLKDDSATRAILTNVYQETIW